MRHSPLLIGLYISPIHVSECPVPFIKPTDHSRGLPCPDLLTVIQSDPFSVHFWDTLTVFYTHGNSGTLIVGLPWNGTYSEKCLSTPQMGRSSPADRKRGSVEVRTNHRGT